LSLSTNQGVPLQCLVLPDGTIQSVHELLQIAARSPVGGGKREEQLTSSLSR
jgi:hypothetical protein